MELYLLRHGEAGKRLPAGGKDSQRPLTVSGLKEVQEIAKALSELDIKFDHVLTSPLKRAYQTAEIVAEEFHLKKDEIDEWDELKPEGSRHDLYLRLSQLKRESSILIVGHEPNMSSTVSDIIFGAGSSGHIILKKGGLARIGISSFQPKVKGELRWLLTPRHLKKIAK